MSVQALVIVPCGAVKRAIVCAAGEMYLGPYHRACLAYARSIVADDDIRILSAKYGFLRLSAVIKPYEREMTKARAGALKSILAHEAVSAGIARRTHVVALGGALYVDVCRHVWPHCETPLDGIGGLGKQIQWLREQAKQPAK